VEIVFGNRRLSRVLNSEANLVETYGPQNAKTIRVRLAFLAAAPSLKEVPRGKPTRCHELRGNRTGQFAVDLKHPQRLVFVPAHNPVPHLADGGYDLERITAIEIVAVEDYH